MRTLTPFVLLGLALGYTTDAGACGCFTPPDPSVPIVQAGERIAFAMSDGQVTANIQIQYQGTASDFGWLLPLPSVPTLELGTDELFTQLFATTQPQYKVNRVYEGNCSFDPSRGGGIGLGGTPTANGAGGAGGAGGGDTGTPLVYQDSIGPYDYAVLKADTKDAMLQWLADNHYFVPTGTDDAIGPYIHPGAYFLALKLKSGNDVGDLQPVVVKYASDLPMIPLVLTSVAANPHMGIQVWMLGAGRAIPRNYYHTVINDAKLDWLNGSQNYNDVIIAATAEAPDKHSFVTEYAGASTPMQERARTRRAASACSPSSPPRPPTSTSSTTCCQHQFPFTSQTVAVLQKYIPIPPRSCRVRTRFSRRSSTRTSATGSARTASRTPDQFIGWTENFQPVQMAQDLQDRVVTPTLAAGAMFDQFPYLTRLYTTLSPEDMNKDPVFSFNPGLKDWSNVHNGTLTYHCGFFGDRGIANTAATLRTEEGWVIDYPNGTGVTKAAAPADFAPPGGPSSQRIEILREQGNPDVIVDNTSSISNALGGGGCGVTIGGRASRQYVGLFGLIAIAGLMLLGRRRAELMRAAVCFVARRRAHRHRLRARRLRRRRHAAAAGRRHAGARRRRLRRRLGLRGARRRRRRWCRARRAAFTSGSSTASPAWRPRRSHVHRESRRVSDDALVLLADGTQDVGTPGDDGWWELPTALPSFMCPTPIGINVIDERIVFQVTLTTMDGPPLAKSSAEATVHCPDGAQAAFCAKICSG